MTAKKEVNIFDVNPGKASAKIAFSSTMIGVLFFILTIILTLEPYKFNKFVVFQIILAVPFLFLSILTYSKIAYMHDNRLWDLMGWYVINIGNTLVLNVIGLMVSTSDHLLSFIYFGLLITLMLIYSLINIHNTGRASQRLFKFVFFVALIVLGGVLPIFLA